MTDKNAAPSIPVPGDVIEQVLALRKPIVISHVVPDADALGSAFSMALGLQRDGCAPKVALPDGSLSQRLTFLSEMAGVTAATNSDYLDADGFIILDTAKVGRSNVGKERKEGDWIGGRPVINIDHHATNTQFGTVNWIVADAGSTCELVYHLLRAANRPVTPEMASLMFAGIQTDTLGFSLPTTRPSALRTAAELLECGADVGVLGEKLGRSQRKSEFNLLRIIYANTKVMAGGRMAYSCASYDEIHNAGCSAADIDEQINVPRSLEGVELAMLFTEGRKGKTRINFRGSGDVTVVELAARFNGGGHAQAAGAILDCALEEAIDKVVPVAVEHLNIFP